VDPTSSGSTNISLAIGAFWRIFSWGGWKKLAENQIGQTKPTAYEQAGICLNKLRHLYSKLGKEPDWQIYLTNLRSANIRKTRFLEVLNRLSAKPVIETG
jgi:uncharacterized Zn finger protein